MHSSRREFLKISALCAASGVFSLNANSEDVKVPAKLFSGMGMAAPIARAELLKEQGAEFLTVATDELLMPSQPDEAFEKNLAKIKGAALPVLACNGFIRPKNLRCVGKDANHDQVMAWAEVVFRRLKQVGGKFVVFGSGGSRELRDGWAKDEADQQFVALLQRMGPLAEKHEVKVVVEQLQASECNYINRIGQLAALIRKAAHPNVRALADLYHMARGGDTPEDLKAAMDVVVHVEIAEKAGRTYPGIKGDDFRPFFRVLREAGYNGAISMEGKGGDPQIGLAFREIAKQASEV